MTYLARHFKACRTDDTGKTRSGHPPVTIPWLSLNEWKSIFFIKERFIRKKNMSSTGILCFLKLCFMPLCFYTRPRLVLVFINQKKFEEGFGLVKV